jgi:hypothetical protein
MTRRAIVGAEETGSITRLEARMAARAVKMARPQTGGRSKTPLSEAVIARYLGHFGVGASKTTGKNGFGVKRAGKRSAAKKAK